MQTCRRLARDDDLRNADICVSVLTAAARAMLPAFMQGLWRGTLAGQLLYVPYTVVQFVTLQQVNLAARRMNLTDSRAAPLVSYASGAAAGIAATCVSYPFDLLRTTLAAQGEPKVSSMG